MAIRSHSDPLVKTLHYYTRTDFPRRARTENWPIRRHHCFERTVFDAVVRDKWYNKIDQPFYTNASDEQLSRAIRICRQIDLHPRLLPLLHLQSLYYRGKITDPVQAEQLERDILVDHTAKPEFNLDPLGKPIAD